MFSLIIIDLYTKKQIVLMESESFSQIYNKYKLVNTYRRNLPKKENTKSKRKLIFHINRKLSKIFNKNINFINSKVNWYDVVAIKHISTNRYYSYHRFFKVNSGFVPNDRDINSQYQDELDTMNLLTTVKWQQLNSNLYKFKYFNL